MDLRYDETVGRGAFGEVWRATDEIGRQLAVKFFRGTTPDLEEMEAERHAHALSRVSHQAVVRLYALERQTHPEDQSERLAIVMEYVPGVSLAQHKGDLSEASALAVVTCLVEGLAAIHSQGLTHGDFHEGNVMVTPEGAKIIDILYTHSLRDVGTRTGGAQVGDDLRSLAKVVRGVLEKNPIARRISSRIHAAYCRANDRAKSCHEVQNEFKQILAIVGAAGRGGTEAGAELVDPDSLKWYFLNDERPGHRIDSPMELVVGGTPLPVLARGYADFDANARYVCFYVPEHPAVEAIVEALVRDPQQMLQIFSGIEATYGHESGTDPPRHLSEMQFTGRVALYLENLLAAEQRARIETCVRASGLFPHVRDKTYAEMRNRL